MLLAQFLAATTFTDLDHYLIVGTFAILAILLLIGAINKLR